MSEPARRARLATLVVAIAVLVAAPLAVVASDAFTDVADSNPHHDDITWLADNGITLGCNPPDNDEFCPDDAVLRQQMASFMRRLAENQVVDADALDGHDSADFLRSDSVLQDGETQIGAWGVSAHDGGYAFYTIEFSPVLPAELPPTNMHYLEAGATTANCPGIGEAAAGHLCVYEAWESNMTHNSFTDPEGSETGSAVYGVVPYFLVNGADAYARGSWAVTGWTGTLSDGGAGDSDPDPSP